ncbi:MAG: hypothetical protein V1888_00310 [archaeon]
MVNELIRKGELSRDVLGVSFGNNTSNFLDYVSLCGNDSCIESVAQEISMGRTGLYSSEKLLSFAFVIDNEIKKSSNFFDNEAVMRMESFGFRSFPGEVLYYGNIPKKFIKRIFAARTH